MFTAYLKVVLYSAVWLRTINDTSVWVTKPFISRGYKPRINGVGVSGFLKNQHRVRGGQLNECLLWCICPPQRICIYLHNYKLCDGWDLCAEVSSFMRFWFYLSLEIIAAERSGRRGMRRVFTIRELLRQWVSEDTAGVRFRGTIEAYKPAERMVRFHFAGYG